MSTRWPDIDTETRRRYRAQAADWARDLLESGEGVILDCETTGLFGKPPAPEPQMVQLAVVEADAGGRALIDTLIKPSCEVSEGARRVHGITDDRLRSAPGFADVFPALHEALAGRRVVIYNAAFDRRVYAAHLRREGLEDAPRHPLADPRYPWECAMFRYSRYRAEPDPGEATDVRGGPRRRFKRHKLPGAGHSALADARATLELVRAMARDRDPRPDLDLANGGTQ